MTHFGAAEDVDAQLDELSARLDDWAARAREQDQDDVHRGRPRGDRGSMRSRSSRRPTSRRRRPSSCTPGSSATGASAPSAVACG